MSLKKTIISFTLLLALVVPFLSSAAILEPDLIGRAECNGSGCTLNTFIELAISVATFILGIVGALTLLMFIYGGFMWILSGGSSEKVTKGKDIIIGSVAGLLIVLCSYLIISFVSNTLLKSVGTAEFTGRPLPDTAKTTDTTAPQTIEKCAPSNCISSDQCKGDTKKPNLLKSCNDKPGTVCCETDLTKGCNGICVRKVNGKTPPCQNGGKCAEPNKYCCVAGTLIECHAMGGHCNPRLGCGDDKCGSVMNYYCYSDGDRCCSDKCDPTPPLNN